MVDFFFTVMHYVACVRNCATGENGKTHIFLNDELDRD